MRVTNLLLAGLAAVSLATPLSKRSFKAPAAGRGKLTPYLEVANAHRKYGCVLDAPTTTSTREPPAPFSTVTISTTLYAYGSSATASPTEIITSSSIPPYLNTSSTVSAPSSATSGLEDGSVSATPEENEQSYLSPVTVGGQKLNLNFDTGSADLWVVSTALTAAEIGKHTAFNPQKSSTWQDLPGATWNITYGDTSSAVGTVGYDTVDVGGITAKKQAVEIATQISSQFISDDNTDGLLGLAFSSINTVQPQPQKTFFENVMDDLSEPLFTADLEETDGKGTYEFGKIDKSKYKGAIHYVPVDTSNGWWQIDIPSFSIGGNKTACKTCNPAIADTGTSLLYVDLDVVSEYYSQVPSAVYVPEQQGYVYKCSEHLPSFGISLGDDFTATIKGSDITYMKTTHKDREMCFGGIQSMSPPNSAFDSGLQIVGDVFLKQFFAVFDAGALRFGVAEKD